MRLRPAQFVWRNVEVLLADGIAVPARALVPEGRFKALCERQFVLDETYAWGPVDNVDNGSRGAFFASVRETWNSLAEDDERFPSHEHLRKRALVAAGWCLHSQTVMDTPKDARQLAIQSRKLDEYAVIQVKANVVDVYIAKSIAHGQITAEEWRVVKPRALDWVAAQINVKRTELEHHSKDGGAR